jgi:hypothetical protein
MIRAVGVIGARVEGPVGLRDGDRARDGVRDGRQYEDHAENDRVTD